MEIPFRLAETPVFLPPALRDEMVEASLEIFRQLSTPAALRRSRGGRAAALRRPRRCDDLPRLRRHGLRGHAREGGRLAPKLIELQAFPTLYGFQVAQSEELSAICPDAAGLGWYLSGLDTAGYKRVVGEAILAGLPPENVVLLDLDPPRQKTAIDFVFTEQFWGVRAVDPGEIEKRGRELWYRRDGKPHADPPDLQPAHLRRARGQGRHAALRPHLPARRVLGRAPQLVLPLVEALPSGI